MSRIVIKHVSHLDNVISYRDILGRLHRENGPAVIEADGKEKWYYNDEYLKDVHSVEDLIIKQILE